MFGYNRTAMLDYFVSQALMISWINLFQPVGYNGIGWD
jgi:hypothetical protein